MLQTDTTESTDNHLNSGPGDTIIPQKIIPYPDVKALFKLFGIYLLYTIAGIILLGVFLADSKNLATPLVKKALTLLFSVVTMLLTISYATKRSKKSEPESFNLSFNRIPPLLIPVLVITTLALVVGLEQISDLIPMPDAVKKLFEKVFTKDIFSVINVIIAAPILEEILFRGIVLKGLLKNYAPRKAIIISALFFAIFHLNPWQAIPAFFGGLFLGWTFYKTRSVIPGMIIHATINTTSMVFLFLQLQFKSLNELLGTPYYIVLCVAAAIIFTGGCLFIERKRIGELK
jgi:membrane protease YdiL (CAAX protease family)